MKKILVISLVLLFMLAIAGTALAASASFTDVPPNNWAYDAINKLVKAGVVDGYNDKTFQGDKPMTRYEMAVLVAKAMQNFDRGNDETKAILDKMSIEYSRELTDMGVRLSALENTVKKNQKSLINWDGSNFRIRYDHKTKNGVTTSTPNDFNYNIELVANGQIGDGWATELKIEGNRNMSGGNNSVDNKSGAFDLESYKAFGPLGGGILSVGRMENNLINGLVIDQFMTGFSYQTGNKLKATVTEGKLDSYNALPNSTTVVTDINPNLGVTFASLNLAYPVNENTNVQAGYYRTYSSSQSCKPAKIWELAFTQQLSPDFKLIGDYARSNRSDNNKAYLAGISYKTADIAKVKSYGWTVDYVRNEAKATVGSVFRNDNLAIADYGYNAPAANKNLTMDKTNGQKGYELTYQYVPMQDVLFTGRYLEAKPINGSSYDKVKWYRAQVEFFF